MESHPQNPEFGNNQATIRIEFTCMADVLTSNFLKMAKASSYSSFVMAILAISGAS